MKSHTERATARIDLFAGSESLYTPCSIINNISANMSKK